MEINVMMKKVGDTTPEEYDTYLKEFLGEEYESGKAVGLEVFKVYGKDKVLASVFREVKNKVSGIGQKETFTGVYLGSLEVPKFVDGKPSGESRGCRAFFYEASGDIRVVNVFGHDEFEDGVEYEIVARVNTYTEKATNTTKNSLTLDTKTATDKKYTNEEIVQFLNENVVMVDEPNVVKGKPIVAKVMGKEYVNALYGDTVPVYVYTEKGTSKSGTPKVEQGFNFSLACTDEVGIGLRLQFMSYENAKNPLRNIFTDEKVEQVAAMQEDNDRLNEIATTFCSMSMIVVGELEVQKDLNDESKVYKKISVVNAFEVFDFKLIQNDTSSTELEDINAGLKDSVNDELEDIEEVVEDTSKPLQEVAMPKPKVETPKVEIPKVETPKVETPVAEVSKNSEGKTLGDEILDIIQLAEDFKIDQIQSCFGTIDPKVLIVELKKLENAGKVTVKNGTYNIAE